jgi:plastocyanin
LRAIRLIVVSALAAACQPAARATYQPRMRNLIVTTVPLLVKEATTLYPFLARDFAAGGVLAGKEVYGFAPGTLTVVAGDTIHFTFVNPEDDLHTFVLPDFAVSLPGQRITEATYVARRPGIYPFRCNLPSHAPMMAGQLIVLSPAAVALTPG